MKKVLIPFGLIVLLTMTVTPTMYAAETANADSYDTAAGGADAALRDLELADPDATGSKEPIKCMSPGSSCRVN